MFRGQKTSGSGDNRLSGTHLKPQTPIPKMKNVSTNGKLGKEKEQEEEEETLSSGNVPRREEVDKAMIMDGYLSFPKIILYKLTTMKQRHHYLRSCRAPSFS